MNAQRSPDLDPSPPMNHLLDEILMGYATSRSQVVALVHLVGECQQKIVSLEQRIAELEPETDPTANGQVPTRGVAEK